MRLRKQRSSSKSIVDDFLKRITFKDRLESFFIERIPIDDIDDDVDAEGDDTDDHLTLIIHDKLLVQNDLAKLSAKLVASTTKNKNNSVRTV